MIDMLFNSLLFPDQYYVMGGTYVTPVKEGLLAEDFVEKLQAEGTFDDTSFDREYQSIWAGDQQDSFFSSEMFDKNRKLMVAEEKAPPRIKDSYYIIAVDVGRTDCTTEICVFRVTPQPQGGNMKSLVNIYSIEAEDFEAQAIKIKKVFFNFKARIAVIDANGIGIGLVDFMTKVQIDPETGDELPAFGVEGGTNAEIHNQYKKVQGNNVIKNAMYLIKANAPINSEAHAYVQTQLRNSKIRFLIDEREALLRLLEKKAGQKMTPEERAEHLRPYVQTTILKDQMMALVEQNEGVNIILKSKARALRKDKFSAFEYGLYYIKQLEDNKKRTKRNIADMMFFS